MKTKTKYIIIVIAALLVTILFVNTYNITNEIVEDTAACKSLGYDGGKFVDKFSPKIECYNYMELGE